MQGSRIRPASLRAAEPLAQDLLRQRVRHALFGSPVEAEPGDCGAGPTLAEWLDDDRRSIHEIVDVFVGVGRGLAAAHAAGIVHRDFGPGHVVFDESGRPRVVGFGSSRTPDIDETDTYVAPEQVAGDPVDARSDQFSFALSLMDGLAKRFRLGRLPLSARCVDATFERVLEGFVGPDWLVSALRRGLRVDPADRFASMDELLDALERGRRSVSCS